MEEVNKKTVSAVLKYYSTMHNAWACEFNDGGVLCYGYLTSKKEDYTNWQRVEAVKGDLSNVHHQYDLVPA